MASKAKSRRQQRRHPPTLEPRGRMLIVVEGAKTEKFYFEGARQALGLQHGQAIVVKPGQGTNPKNIVETAIRLKNEAAREGNAFSAVYCVFDRDQHPYYEDSISRARDRKMESIKSVPCFEYWVLLHFRDHTAPYAGMGNQSACDHCRHDVQAAWPEYRKNHQHLYTELCPRLADARQRAKQRLAAAKAEGSDNPSTEIHHLLDAMQALRQFRQAR